MGIEIIFLILLIITSIVGIIANKLNFPYTISLVLVGLLIGYFHLINAPHLSKDLLYYIFLPPLIFQTAIHLKFNDLKRDFIVILTLVIPGVILSTIITAIVFMAIGKEFFSDISLSIGLLFGAAVSATDPVAVISIFERLGTPKRLRFLIDSESLLNDGTSIVIFTIVLEIIKGKFSYNIAIIDFFFVVGVGIFIGYIIGIFADEIIKRVYDPMIVMTITTVSAYFSFILADRLGVSGVMSTVVTGLIIGTKSFDKEVYPSIKIATETFWNYIAFLTNSLIFLLIGLSININMLINYWQWILIAYIAMIVARYIVVLFTWGIFANTSYKFPFSWAIVMGWGGIRGALTMVLAMSLPDSFKYKELIVTMVFGVVLISILVQGITMPFLIKFLKLDISKEEILEYEELKTRIKIIQNIIAYLNELNSKMLISDSVYDELIKEYREKLTKLNQKIKNLNIDFNTYKTEEILKLKREILMREKEYLMDLYKNGNISNQVYKKLADEIDSEIFELENIGI